MKTILIMNGPNLSMLGKRDPKHYGSGTLADLENACINKGIELGVKVVCFQSESESALIRKLHTSMGVVDGIVLNAGAYTHYSIAIRDAIELIKIPVVEVHLSDIHNREDFRNRSVIEAVCVEQISGLGVKSYLVAMEKLVDKYMKDTTTTEELKAEEKAGPEALLAEERLAVDQLNKELLVLFERRMKHVERIAKIKMEMGKETYVPAREQEILEQAGNGVEKQYADLAQDFMKEIMRLSKERQTRLRNETHEE
ncbi:MAG: type II 3-dehydroquinate dehydratase [Clostridiales bacterium]|nr:type II 3-dehydroquinate dehydratase [Clostridiales bacterium]